MKYITLKFLSMNGLFFLELDYSEGVEDDYNDENG